MEQRDGTAPDEHFACREDPEVAAAHLALLPVIIADGGLIDLYVAAVQEFRP